MTQSNCVRCGETRFEMRDAPPMAGTDCLWFFVQCESCGGVVGLVDFYPNRTLLKRIDQIASKLGLED